MKDIGKAVQEIYRGKDILVKFLVGTDNIISEKEAENLIISIAHFIQADRLEKELSEDIEINK